MWMSAAAGHGLTALRTAIVKIISNVQLLLVIQVVLQTVNALPATTVPAALAWQP